VEISQKHDKNFCNSCKDDGIINTESATSAGSLYRGWSHDDENQCSSQATLPRCEVIPISVSPRCDELDSDIMQINTLFRRLNSNELTEVDKETKKISNEAPFNKLNRFISHGKSSTCTNNQLSDTQTENGLGDWNNGMKRLQNWSKRIRQPMDKREEEDEQLKNMKCDESYGGITHKIEHEIIQLKSGESTNIPQHDDGKKENKSKTLVEMSLDDVISTEDDNKIRNNYSSIDTRTDEIIYLPRSEISQDLEDAQGNYRGFPLDSQQACSSGRPQDGGSNLNSPKVNINGSFFNERQRKANVKPIQAYPNGVRMSESELYAEMLRPSETFEKLVSTSLINNSSVKTSTGSINLSAGQNGQIGTLKVELLACMGLPKFSRTKPNAIAYLICGDVPFATDIISSARSPMWPARSKRAATFPIFHAYAKLYVGIFGATDKENDNFVGRSVIDIAVLRPNSLYDVTLPLKSSTFIHDQITRGVVRLRFSLDWFVERAAVLSSMPSFKLGRDMVTIPCADSKALKNVAFAIHGEDLPGVYSRKAWKANTREIALYHLNIKVALTNLVWDTMMYENIILSSYVFIVWLLILYFNSITMVPPFAVSFTILIYIENYFVFNSKEATHTGYSSLSVKEIFLALISGSSGSEKNGATMKALEVRCQGLESERGSLDDMVYMYRKLLSDKDVENKDTGWDHSEFPFSEKKYGGRKKILTSSTSRKVPKNEIIPTGIRNRVQKDTLSSVENLQTKNKVEVNTPTLPETVNTSKYSELHQIFDSIFLSRTKRVLPAGPEQFNEIQPLKGEGKTFQDNACMLDAKLHSMSGHIFHKQVSRPIHLSENESSGQDSKKSLLLSENEKMQGLQTKYGNPLIAMTAKFLEPVMRCLQVYLSIVRAGFSVATWKDPYMSFWILIGLIFLMIFLIVFPWKLFFLIIGIVSFGPQNLVFRLADKKKLESSHSAQHSNKGATSSAEPDQKCPDAGEEEQEFSSVDLSGQCCSRSQRPLFAVQSGNKKKFTPQEIIVPYGRLRQERFFHWPPYRSVSCSTDLTGMAHILFDDIHNIYGESNLADIKTKPISIHDTLDKSVPMDIKANQLEHKPLRKRNKKVCTQ